MDYVSNDDTTGAISGPIKRSRRVPPEHRKRAALSCDFCKTRRRKCVRPTLEQPCELCKVQGVDCLSTIPRKPRADEATSLRLSLLEDIVQRLFPDLSLDDEDELHNLLEILEEKEVFLQDSHAGIASQGNAGKASPAATWQDRSKGRDHLFPNGRTAGQAQNPDCSYEMILRNSSGTHSYFGGSASMSFVVKIRELLDVKTKQNPQVLPRRQQELRDEFTSDRHSYTMERDSPDDRLEKGSTLRPMSLGHVQPTQQDPRSKTASKALRDLLLSRQEMEKLVELYFVHVHPNIVLFRRSIFQAAFEDLWTLDESECIDVGWVVCFCVVFAFGCEWEISTSREKETPASQHLAKIQHELIAIALESVAQLILSATLQSVQALAILSAYFNCVNERNASWVLLGCAIRMATSLGLHRGTTIIKGDNRMIPVERELRKRVWWSLYCFEQYSSAMFGRPCSIDEPETNVEMPNESILDEGYHCPPELLQHDVQLAQLIGRIRKSQVEQWSSPTGKAQSLPDMETTKKLLSDLQTWQDQIPVFLKVDDSNLSHIYPNHFRQILTLQLRYQYARLLLGRPFHLSAQNQSPQSRIRPPREASTELETVFSNTCLDAALESWKIIRSLWTSGQFDGNLWLDGLFVYQCSLVLSLTLLGAGQRVRNLDKKRLQDILESMLGILHEAPLNKTMNRLVQITSDFAGIVQAIGSGPGSRTSPQPGSGDPARTATGSILDPTSRKRDHTSVEVMSEPFAPAYPVTLEFDDSISYEANFGFDGSALEWDFEGAEMVGSLVNGDFPYYAFGGLE